MPVSGFSVPAVVPSHILGTYTSVSIPSIAVPRSSSVVPLFVQIPRTTMDHPVVLMLLILKLQVILRCHQPLKTSFF